ncbi:MAG: hypothetical protein ACJ768_11805 [Gaiellaceae bacterium]
MRRIRTAAAFVIGWAMYLISLFFWTVNKGFTVLAAVGLVTLTGKPIAYLAAITITVGVLLALDAVAWFLDREYQRREQTEA